jgi:DNA-binding XRE family transcriptional regulator
MIRSEAEYKNACKRVQEEKSRLQEQEKKYQGKGYSAEEVARLMDPLVTFHLQLQEEVECYEKLKRGDLGTLANFYNLHGIGRLLIALRIKNGLTQKELADKLGVNESQVSRDERNEYHGVTVDRASKILDLLKGGLHSRCEDSPVEEFDKRKLA